MKADEGIGQAEVRHAQIWVQAQCLMERAGRFNPNIRMHVRKPLVIKRLGFGRMRGHFFVEFANPRAERNGALQNFQRDRTRVGVSFMRRLLCLRCCPREQAQHNKCSLSASRSLHPFTPLRQERARRQIKLPKSPQTEHSSRNPAVWFEPLDLSPRVGSNTSPAPWATMRGSRMSRAHSLFA